MREGERTLRNGKRACLTAGKKYGGAAPLGEEGRGWRELALREKACTMMTMLTNESLLSELSEAEKFFVATCGV